METTSIIPYEGINLATIATDDLRKYVDGWVRRLATASGRAQKILKDWQSNGSPDMMTADQVIEAKKKYEAEIKRFEDYRDEQESLFSSKGLPRNYANTRMIVATGETTTAGLPVCRIIDRGINIEEIEDDDGDHAISIASSRSYSERAHLSATRGKYNDEGRLFDQDSASISVGEVAEWTSPCM